MTTLSIADARQTRQGPLDAQADLRSVLNALELLHTAVAELRKIHPNDVLTAVSDQARLVSESVRAIGLSEPATPAAKTEPGADFGLTEREQAVCELVQRGLSSLQIARELFISTSTVTFHLGRIYSKTGVTSRHELAASLWRHGQGAAA